MSEPRLCCNCLHCARWKKKNGIECHCDLDDRYLGYLTVMDEENDCKHWEKETKWDLEREHDKQIREDAIDECIDILYEVTPQTIDEKLDMVFVNALKELKERSVFDD